MIKRNWSSIWKISLLVVKYLFLYVISMFLNLKEFTADTKIGILFFLLVIDVFVGWNEKDKIFRGIINEVKYLTLLLFGFIVTLDIHMIINFYTKNHLIDEDTGLTFIDIVISIWLLYFLINSFRLFVKESLGEENYKNLKFTGKIKVFFIMWFVSFLISRLLLSDENTLLVFFVGVILVFAKWIYSEDVLYFFIKENNKFNYSMIPTEIKIKFKKIQGAIVIVLVSLNMAVIIKKIFFELEIIKILISKLKDFLNLEDIQINNIIVIFIAGVIFLWIVNTISTPGNLLVKQQQEVVNNIEKKHWTSKKTARMMKLKKR